MWCRGYFEDVPMKVYPVQFVNVDEFVCDVVKDRVPDLSLDQDDCIDYLTRKMIHPCPSSCTVWPDLN